ncbi:MULTISPECIES: MFS transporter [unclassified Solwaraspora]|uniref:MFS transporter n=1 Tax=unclassified Solwaraspora TaxID=2627926 RepID=UPI00248C162D|nr:MULTISPECIES: MFS transporter [unclassified Solwaraspora]WBB97206.1 MFS transporter [Solwaraspora sp. WMMA2059]WBC18892.1 MFS transporter [Solwaraspora sp. WMMA2080]WJK33705.1 MFS transporter [Solwaraspora sp. WMMA2065]
MPGRLATSIAVDRPLRPAVAAQAASVVGTHVAALALPTVAVVALHASPVAAATLFALEYGAQALAAPLLGVVVDRVVDRRRLLMAASAGTAAVVLAVPVAALAGVLSLPLLYAVAGLSGVLGGLVTIGLQATVPQLVEPDRLVPANAALAGAQSAGQIAGPALAGWLVQTLGGALAMSANAAAQALAAVGFAALRPRPGGPPPAPEHPLRALRDGVAALRGRPELVRIAVTAAALNLGGSAIGGLYVLYAYRVLDLSPWVLGLTFAVNSVAAVAGVTTARRVIARLGHPRVVPVFAPLAGAALMLIPLAAVTPSVLTLIVYETIFGYCATVWLIASVSLQQSVVPGPLLGRVLALSRALAVLAVPIGSLLAGVAAQLWGVLPTLICFAAVAFLGTVAVVSRRVAAHNLTTS